MLNLRLGAGAEPVKLLCLGAHPDDIEIGCGGTIIHLIAQRPVEIRWVVFTGNALRAAEARAACADLTTGAAKVEIVQHAFRDGYLPYEGPTVKDQFETLRQGGYEPDLVLTHCLQDAHQDHRTIAELTYNTFRNHLVLEYEIPKHDGDLGNPTVFVPLSEAEARRKTAALQRHFVSQHRRDWFSEETFLALMRLRGTFAPVPSGFAEGFYCRKAILD